MKLPTPERCAYYDDWLWRFQADSFLPHGTTQNERHAKDQPVLITHDDIAANGAKMALVAEEAALPPAQAFDLVCYLFDSENPSRLQTARGLWKTLKETGDAALTYWQQQNDGRWVKQDI